MSTQESTASKKVTPPKNDDLFRVRDLLTEEERQVQDLVRRWVDERALPLMPAAFDEHRFPSELIPEIAEMGLLGCTIDGYDCAGMSSVCSGVINQELERADSGLRSFVSVQGSLSMYPIWAFGTEEQKQHWLPKMAAAEAIGCFGLTEPDGGSDPGTMKTTARLENGEWVLNGAKMWITNGTIADVAIIWAQTEDGIRGFLVEKDAPGYTTRDILKKYSLRASVTSELFFDNCRIPEANLLPNVKGLRGPLSCLTQARFGIVWGCIGAAQACLEELLEFTKTRVLFGKTLDSKQTVQLRLADMARRITTGQLLALQLGRMKDAGTMHPSQVSLAKWNNVRMALDIARDARDLLGAGGITVEYASIRHMLNLESVITYEGTETIHQLTLGRQLTGQSAF